jgi:hypothetical protein
MIDYECYGRVMVFERSDVVDPSGFWVVVLFRSIVVPPGVAVRSVVDVVPVDGITGWETVVSGVVMVVVD